jgi:hypothetical protein
MHGDQEIKKACSRRQAMAKAPLTSPIPDEAMP